MDEEEAEKAATAAVSAPKNQSSDADGAAHAAIKKTYEGGTKMAAQVVTVEEADGEAGEEETVAPAEPRPKGSEEVEEKTPKEPGEEESDDAAAMEVSLGSAKRPREKGEEAVAAQRLRKLEHDWRTATGKKGKYVPAPRSSSLDRGNPTRDDGSGQPPPTRK